MFILMFIISAPITGLYLYTLYHRHWFQQNTGSIQSILSIFAVEGIGCLLGLIITSFLIPAYALAADKVPAHIAIGASVKAMWRQFGMAFLFLFCVGFIFMLGSILTCDLGFLVTVPLACIISALAYRDMIGMPGIRQPEDVTPIYGQQIPGSWPPAPGTWPPPPGSYQQQPYYGAPPQPYGQPSPPAPEYLPSSPNLSPPPDTSPTTPAELGEPPPD